MGVLLFATQGVLAAEPLQEVRATEQVCSRGPAQRVAAAVRQSGEASVTAAGVLPNPSFVGSYQTTLDGLTDREVILGLAVPLGIGGRYFLLRDAAEERREQASSAADAMLLEAGLAFRGGYAKAVIDEARFEVRRQHQATLDGLSDAIRRLEKGGEASAYDLLRQQTQARLHRRLLQAAQGEAQASRARLDAWFSEPFELSKADPMSLANVPHRSPGDAVETPRVRSLRAEARATAIEASAARRRWVPDLQVFAGYRGVGIASETGHGISLGLTVPLTFFDHGQGEAAQADAAQVVAEAEAERLGREQSAELRAAHSRLSALDQAVADTEAASLEAAKLEADAQRLYQAGEATITELLEALQDVENARLSRLDLAEELAMARLTLMRASGTMFDETLDRACGATRKAQ
jgi:outer membrane protein TolC